MERPVSAVIAVDVTAALIGSTGVARYATALPDALEALGVSLRRFAVCRPQPAGTPPGVRQLPVPRRAMAGLWRTGHPRIETWLRGRVDLVHGLDLLPPPSGAPAVLTVHDLGALERPDLHSATAVRAAQLQLDAARSAAAVCAVSGATAEALVGRGVPRGLITVTPHAAASLPAAAGPAVRPPGYLLAVGMLTPRKGLDVLVRALKAPGLRRQRLLLVGPDGHRAAEVHAAVEASADALRIERLGHVDDPTLAVLLRDAACLVLPSRVEGFGLPVLEAQAVGLPVVCSDLPALREVGGSAPFYAAPDSSDDLAAAIARALAEPAGSPRLAAGTAHASTFTWERSARATVAAYEKVLGCRLLP